MTEADRFDTPLDYKDRRASLIISGIILGLIGCMIGLMSAFYIAVFGFAGDMFSMPAPTAPGAAGSADVFSEKMMDWMVISGCIYGVVALAFIGVAVGNLFLKRWSRPLALILSGCWGYTGLVSVGWIVVMWPNMQTLIYQQAAQGPTPPPGSSTPNIDVFMNIIMIVYVVIFFVFGVMLPGLIFWLNLSRDARITLEVCDKKPRWTERCPVPVLALAVIAFTSGVLFLGSAFWMPFMPVFGKMLTGQSARLVLIGISLVLMVVGWLAYRKQIVAWALAIVGVICGTISGMLSFSNFDWGQMYEMMGMPEQAEEMQEMLNTIYSGNTMIITMLISALPVLAYLIWILKFFRESPDQGRSPDGLAGG